MSRRKLLLMTCTLLFSSTLYAGQSISNKEIEYIATGWGAEGLYIDTVVKNTSIEGCGTRYRIDPNHPMLAEMMSLLLSAFHTGTKVDLYVEGCIATDTMNLKSVAIRK